MSENRTVVYTPDAGSGSGSGMMAMLAPLLQQKGIDPNLLMALNSKGNGNGFGGDGSWFLWIIFLFFLFPLFGRNGWGNDGGNGGKSSLTSFQPFQQLMAVASAFGLDRSSHFIVSIAYILDFIRGYISPVRQGDNIGYTHIHSKKILRCLFFFVWNVYRLIEVEFPFDKNKISFSLCELHELWTIASICHLLTPINKRNGADTSLGIVGKYTTVIRDSSEFTETSLFFSVEFVCIGNLADCTYNKLGGKAVCPLDWMVNLLVQAELIEYTTFPCYLRDSVASLIKNAKCLFQHYGLLVRWNQFYLQSQFHVTKIWEIIKLFKYLKKIILLSLKKRESWFNSSQKLKT